MSHSPSSPTDPKPNGQHDAQRTSSRDDSFEQAAATEQPSFLSELWAFLAESKKWWLTPILVVLLLMAVLILLSSTGAAPFIYTLF